MCVLLDPLLSIVFYWIPSEAMYVLLDPLWVLRVLLDPLRSYVCFIGSTLKFFVFYSQVCEVLFALEDPVACFGFLREENPTKWSYLDVLIPGYKGGKKEENPNKTKPGWLDICSQETGYGKLYCQSSRLFIRGTFVAGSFMSAK